VRQLLASDAEAAGPPPFENMRWIPPGEFLMGSEDFYPEERPVHRVVVDGFWMDERPVTVAALVGACCVSVLRLPLASVMIATLLSARAGLEVAPLIVIAVVVAYLASELLSAYVDARIGRTPDPAPIAAAPGRT
jgi:hypothetical protein